MYVEECFFMFYYIYILLLFLMEKSLCLLRIISNILIFPFNTFFIFLCVLVLEPVVLFVALYDCLMHVVPHDIDINRKVEGYQITWFSSEEVAMKRRLCVYYWLYSYEMKAMEKYKQGCFSEIYFCCIEMRKGKVYFYHRIKECDKVCGTYIVCAYLRKWFYERKIISSDLKLDLWTMAN